MKTGILLGKYITDFQINVLKHILDDSSLNIKLVVIDDRPTISIRTKIKKNLKRRRGGYIMVMAAQQYFSKENNFSTEDYFRTLNIDVLKTTDLYSESTRSTIESYFVDVLVLLGGFGIIKKPLLSLCPHGILSYHHGNMRKYRGMPPAFWELYNGRNDMGLTVQKLTERLDCGVPVVEKTVEIELNDNLRTLRNRAYGMSEVMMHQALKNISRKNFKPESIKYFGKVYTLPNLKQWLILNYRITKRKIIFNSDIHKIQELFRQEFSHLLTKVKGLSTNN